MLKSWVSLKVRWKSVHYRCDSTHNQFQTLFQMMRSNIHFSDVFESDFNSFIMHQALTRKISLNQALQDGESSPTKFDHSPQEMTPFILQKYQNIQFEYLNLANILSRPHSSRSHNEQRFLSEFAHKNNALRSLSQLIGPDFSKGILRSANLDQYARGEIIEQKGSPVERIYVILQGRLGAVKNEDESDMLAEVSRKQIYEHLTGQSRRQIKRMSKLVRKFSSWREEYESSHEKLDNFEETQFLECYQQNTTFGDKALSFGNAHTHTTVAIESTLLLAVNVKNLMYWLNYCFQRKLQSSFQVLRRHPCFSWLSQELLEAVVEILTVVRMKKGDVIYHQDSEAAHIYFLQQGEVKIEKNSHLFVENPNELYVHRKNLMNQREISKKQYLAYADLHLLYNYRPMDKILDLGILTPGCLFGEEEILQGRPRATTVRCTSLKGTYFSIELKKLYTILAEKVDYFLKGLKEILRDKVRYRQHLFANTINLQNKNNLNYFYQGQGLSQKKRLRSKINQKLTQQTSRSTINSAAELAKPDKVINNNIEYIPPSFDAFNFHRMMRTKLKKISIAQSSEDQDPQNNVALEVRTTRAEEIRQKKIVNDSHTWQLVRDKVEKQFRLGRKLGTLKHDINFKSPLIDNKYFNGIESEMKRLDREKKTGKFTISSSRVHFQAKSKSLAGNLTSR